jgi:hypothetical protein
MLSTSASLRPYRAPGHDSVGVSRYSGLSRAGRTGDNPEGHRREHTQNEPMNFEDVDRQLRERLSTLPDPAREILLETLTSNEVSRAECIGRMHAAGYAPATVELLIDAEEDPALRALLVAVLCELSRG